MEFEQLSMFQETGFKMKKVKPMKILVACEESQAVCKELRKLGHEAYSADIQTCSGNHPEWHILGDVIPLINGDCKFTTMDGVQREIVGEWDMLIAFPPCTYLTSAGTRHYSLKMNSPEKVEARIKERNKAVEFFMKFWNAKCKCVVIENPVGYMNTHFMKPTQIIHPYYFAENEKDTENYVQKRTCLWIRGKSPIERHTFLKKPEPKYFCKGKKCKGKAIGWCEGIKGTTGGQAGRAKARSKTFPGIAKVIAEQLAGDARNYMEG